MPVIANSTNAKKTRPREKLREVYGTFNFRVLFIFSTIALFTLSSSTGLTSDSTPNNRNKVLSFYLYNFLLFVDWPKESLQKNDSLSVCILKDDSFYESFKRLEGQSIKNRRLVINRFGRIEDLEEPCHVLFVGSESQSVIPRIIGKLEGKSVLTVSHLEGFARMGGMVAILGVPGKNDSKTSFVYKEEKKRFEINLTRVQSAGLTIRSRLLRLSNIVEGDSHER